MRIGILRNTFLPKSETFIINQIRNYSAADTVVLTRVSVNSGVHNFEGIPVEEAGDSLFGRALYAISRRSVKLDKAITKYNLQLIHAHFGVDAVYALPLIKKHGIPLVATFHGYDITRLPRAKVWPIAWLNYYLNFHRLLEEGDLFLAVSEYIRTRMLMKGFPEDKVKVHYTGIDVEDILFGAAESNRQEQKILAVGRLAEKKGFEYLIRAFALLKERFPNARLEIVGEGPLEPHLKSVAQEEGCTSSVRFSGYLSRDKVLQQMKSASIFCVPSVTASDGDEEGLPTVILEAAACGLPVIGTANSGIPEAIIDGETGIVVPERDPEAIARGLTSLLEDHALAVAMGYRGREYMEDVFNIRTQTKKLELMYEGLIG